MNYYSNSPETPNFGPNHWSFGLCDLDLWLLAMTFDMDIVSVNGKNSRKFHDDTVKGTLLKRWQTDRQTDRSVQGAAWSQLKLTLKLNLTLKVKFDHPHKTIWFFTKLFCTYGPNLEIKAWTGDWVIAQTNLLMDRLTNGETDAGNDSTRRRKLASVKKNMFFDQWNKS